MQTNTARFSQDDLTEASRQCLQKAMDGEMRGYLYFFLNQEGVKERIGVKGWEAIQNNYTNPANITGTGEPLPGEMWPNANAFKAWLHKFLLAFAGSTQIGDSNLFSFVNPTAVGGQESEADSLCYITNTWWTNIIPPNNWLNPGQFMTPTGPVMLSHSVFSRVIIWTGKDINGAVPIWTHSKVHL
eukprot:TRINITY_DN580_c0_g1_i11.p1 TRINITY_DN580_c0_g1~~TRINITY_DN580_c0_g1_i11.p1  ORF type:complete len:186 (+),score=21.26 TRINITY_DN580_c0_g1_i11:204-761(+)